MTDDNFTDFLQRPPKHKKCMFWGESDKNSYLDGLYAVKCNCKATIFYGCILDDCVLDNCTLTRCIVTSSHYGFTQNCTFKDCIIRGSKEHATILDWGEFVNCKIECGQDEERSMKDRTPKDMEATRIKTFEGMHNILLTEPVVDFLRRWAWRCKRKMRARKLKKIEKAPDKMDYMMDNELSTKGREALFFGPWRLSYNTRKASAVHENEILLECDDFKDATPPVVEVPVDLTDDDILPVWSAKKAGKRPFYVNDSYLVEEQLELDSRRMAMWGPRNPIQWAETYGGEPSEGKNY